MSFCTYVLYLAFHCRRGVAQLDNSQMCGSVSAG